MCSVNTVSWSVEIIPFDMAKDNNNNTYRHVAKRTAAKAGRRLSPTSNFSFRFSHFSTNNKSNDQNHGQRRIQEEWNTRRALGKRFVVLFSHWHQSDKSVFLLEIAVLKSSCNLSDAGENEFDTKRM
jgi:hypothetical protein